MEPEDRLSNDEAARAILNGEPAPWVQWCREHGVDPREIVRLLMAQGTTTVHDATGIRMTIHDLMPTDTVLFVSDEGDIQGAITGIGDGPAGET